MKRLLMVTAAWLMVFGLTTPTSAAEEERNGPGERLERLERRIDELAQRQEQMMQRFGALPERQLPVLRPAPEKFAGPMPPGPVPIPAREKVLQDFGGLLKLAVLAGFFCNVLLAVWIFTDIRKRGEGSGIFVALALVAGIPTAIIYSLVRIGDKKV